MVSDCNLRLNVVVYVYVQLILMFFVILGKSSGLLRQKKGEKYHKKERKKEILCTMYTGLRNGSPCGKIDFKKVRSQNKDYLSIK